MYIDGSINKYLDDLSAKLPAPGGGSAAALAGALGVCLILMVLNFTIGKEKYKKFQDKLKEAYESSKELKENLSRLIDEDVEAYKKVSLTFNSQDGTIKEKALKDAVRIPIEVCNYCYKALRICKDIMNKLNLNLISDIGVAAEFLEAAYNSALFNININLKGIKDKEFGLNILKVIEPQIKEVAETRKSIVDFTEKRL